MRNPVPKVSLNLPGKLFFYRLFQRIFFPKEELETLYIAAVCAKSISMFCYAASSISFLFHAGFFQSPSHWFSTTIALLVFTFTALIFGDLIPRTWAANKTHQSLVISSPISSLFLITYFPFSYIFLTLWRLTSKKPFQKKNQEDSPQAKKKIAGLIQETIATTTKLDAEEKKLIESVITFKDRIVREIMVPRVDTFALPASTSIAEAAKLSEIKGYSRIPVYLESIDNIIGILMYKDILPLYTKTEDRSALEASIQTLIKPVLYSPETKKISLLLQEFRYKQTHMAIVVDEYGGTEGIVTIEDILEEIVGEIADEYDTEEILFTMLPHGGWIVDARMSILDIEDQLGLKIPQDAEYDTIGGYVFHRAGTIPSKGLLIHHDDFELEILSSNERCIKKVRITPLTSHKDSNTNERPPQKEYL